MKRAALLGALSAVTILWSAQALATDSAADDEPPKLIPYATDSVGGHLTLGVSGAFVAPFGHVAKDVTSDSRMGNGWGGVIDLGYGVDRQVVLGVYGEGAWMGDSDKCYQCSATSYGAGAFVRYHFVQGLRFDPWISYGLGYRQLSSEQSDLTLNYSGIEWARLQMGATWSILPQLGFSPLLELGGGTMTNVPDGEKVGGSTWRFQVGFQLSLDLPGR